ncbi:GNAT family N-acetyltransferase [Pedobacter changchengzhani]|uniref:GNAT family N-acetyltransferase n=1 Tax=Pedobacter changchengzhani TaxID=2529274 RepID=A0A4R5MJR5_9SPHI|nr:GNAT family N-acetyltransferase [Pedobacter changchengzhani]TDG35907.1 GNAT family N-acetyltransferase [Pedobacter changchengzhani]
MSLLVQKVNHPEDLEKVFAIRKVVFVEEQACPPELEWEHEDESVHFLATISGKPCGACRWRKTEDGYKMERFAVLKEFRGQGVGRALIAEALSDIPEDAHYIYLNSQLNAVSLYAKFGFNVVGEQFEEAGIQHYKMVKKI